MQLAAVLVEGVGRVPETWILIGLFVEQDPDSHWVMQTDHSALSVATGGAMSGAEVVVETKRSKTRQPINQSTVVKHSKDQWTLWPVVDWLIDWLSVQKSNKKAL